MAYAQKKRDFFLSISQEYVDFNTTLVLFYCKRNITGTV